MSLFSVWLFFVLFFVNKIVFVFLCLFVRFFFFIYFCFTSVYLLLNKTRFSYRGEAMGFLSLSLLFFIWNKKFQRTFFVNENQGPDFNNIFLRCKGIRKCAVIQQSLSYWKIFLDCHTAIFLDFPNIFSKNDWVSFVFTQQLSKKVA